MCGRESVDKEVASTTLNRSLIKVVRSKLLAFYGLPPVSDILRELNRRGIGYKLTIFMALPIGEAGGSV